MSRIRTLALVLLLASLPRGATGAASPDKLIAAAQAQVGVTHGYDGSYVQLAYPGGDVPIDRGVCTDVLVRAYRAIGVDLQQRVHEDMRADFAAYPRLWGLRSPDRNIDHRRVPNLATWFARHGETLGVGNDAADYRPGDIVTWRLASGLPHIGLVSDRVVDGRPLIVHNIGAGVRVEDGLFSHTITGHYRYFPEEPSPMKRAQYSQRGPDPQASIEAIEFSPPPLTQGQALVEVLAAPINPSDVLTLTGVYGLLPPLPAIGGNEGVGRVVELGPDTPGPKPGQTVLLPVGCGTWSTHVVADAARLMPLPNGADPKQLSMMTVNPPTALLMLREFVDLQPGDWVIQNAANSGVGAYLIQLAKLRGLKSVNIVRRESAAPGVQELGADVVLVDGDKLAKRVAEATGGATFRLGIDAVGGAATDRLASCLAEGAVLVNYGAMSGEPCQISPGSFVFRDITLRGFWLSRWFKQASPEQRQAVFGEVATLIAQGKLHSRIQATYPVERIKEAVAAAAAGERDGKILVVPAG